LGAKDVTQSGSPGSLASPEGQGHLKGAGGRGSVPDSLSLEIAIGDYARRARAVGPCRTGVRFPAPPPGFEKRSFAENAGPLFD